MGFGLSAVAGETFYRYRNAEGVLVIDYQVPPDLVHKGYEIIDENGEVLDSVAAYDPDSTLSPEEQQAQELQRRQDRLMLKSYSTLDDLYYTRDRKVTALKRELLGIKNTIRDFTELLQTERTNAANIQRSGRDVSDSLKKHIARLAEQLKDAKVVLVKREAELAEMQDFYKRQEQRFIELKGLDNRQTAFAE